VASVIPLRVSAAFPGLARSRHVGFAATGAGVGLLAQSVGAPKRIQSCRTTLSNDLEDSIVQNHIEQRFMNPDATVVFNKAELAKAIHEEADA
jgi:hypothetical protein